MTAEPDTTPGSARTPTPKQRRRARERALQALYQQLLNRTPVDRLEAQFMEDPAMLKLDLEHFRRLVRGVSEAGEALDELFAPVVTRPVAELDPIERAILRLGVFELRDCPDIPWPVILNECIELAKLFGATDGHRFVNGVLDKMAQRLRPDEVRETRSRRGRG
ncbi:MAG: transcription antitermination factor NusB [Halothiobacillaceae bacterium]